MIKVLQILSTVSISRGDFMVALNYYRNIDKEKISFDFIYINECKDNVINELQSCGAKVFKLTCPSLLGGVKKFKDELTKILDNNVYNIVHLHMPTYQNFVKSVIKNRNIKLVVHVHSSKLGTSFTRIFRNKILVTGLNNKIDARLACSQAAGKSIYGKSFLSKENDFVLNNAIQLEKFWFNNNVRKTQRQNLGLKNDEIAICNTGRFIRGKNHTRLIDIFNEMCKKQDNLKLFLIGEGSLKENIKEKVEALNLTNKVVFLGNRNDVNEVLQAMDAFVFPSVFEGLGIVLIEAQAAGLLCFASTECPKDVEVSDNIYRLSLKETDEYWAEFILNRLKQQWNKDTFSAIEDKGYNIKKEADKLEKIYERIIKR